jgi:hypothetical protein
MARVNAREAESAPSALESMCRIFMSPLSVGVAPAHT